MSTNFRGVLLFVFSCSISCMYARLHGRERGRPQYIFACQGSPAQGYRKWASETGGGGYSLSVKQEVAQHLFLGISEGSERTAVCFVVCLNTRRRASRRTIWHSSLFPNSLKSRNGFTQSFHFLLTAFTLCTTSRETNCCQRLRIGSTFQNYSQGVIK